MTGFFFQIEKFIFEEKIKEAKNEDTIVYNWAICVVR